jgi:hypothetical protein
MYLHCCVFPSRALCREPYVQFWGFTENSLSRKSSSVFYEMVLESSVKTPFVIQLESTSLTS